jgi:thiamine biosynthesis lipoprotein
VSDDSFVNSATLMGTVVRIEVVGADDDETRRDERQRGVDAAFDWFRQVEACCSRFDPESALRQLTTSAGTAVSAPQMLFELVRFALALAQETNGAFDPTVGVRMEQRGFDREYTTGRVERTGIDASEAVSYRDVVLDAHSQTITLRRPLVLDLGAVAKGFAIDMAARELAAFENFAIDAGGDLYLGGCNAAGEPWSVGIRHPRDERELIDTMRVSNTAVCTSGDYERRVPGDSPSLDRDAEHHIIDARTGLSATTAASVTVVAPLAIVADGLATAAFVLGPTLGIELLERHGVSGMIVTPSLERFVTRDA